MLEHHRPEAAFGHAPSASPLQVARQVPKYKFFSAFVAVPPRDGQFAHAMHPHAPPPSCGRSRTRSFEEALRHVRIVGAAVEGAGCRAPPCRSFTPTVPTSLGRVALRQTARRHSRRQENTLSARLRVLRGDPLPGETPGAGGRRRGGNRHMSPQPRPPAAPWRAGTLQLALGGSSLLGGGAGPSPEHSDGDSPGGGGGVALPRHTHRRDARDTRVAAWAEPTSPAHPPPDRCLWRQAARPPSPRPLPPPSPPP